MYLLPLTAEVRNYKKINIYCDHLDRNPLTNNGGVGTGLTCEKARVAVSVYEPNGIGEMRDEKGIVYVK